MAETIQVQQRFPAPLLGAIDSHAAKMGVTRTGLVNIMCQSFLEAIEVERLRRENEDLRRKIVAVAMARDEASRDIQVIDHCRGCAVLKGSENCEGCPWPDIEMKLKFERLSK